MPLSGLHILLTREEYIGKDSETTSKTYLQDSSPRRKDAFDVKKNKLQTAKTNFPKMTCSKHWRTSGMILLGRGMVMAFFVSVMVTPKAPLKPSG